MALPVLTSSLPSAPFGVQLPCRLPHVSNNMAEPSCSGIAQFSRPRRKNVLGCWSHHTNPYPSLRAGRAKLVRAAATASSEGNRFPFLTGSAQKLLTEIAQTVDQELEPYLHSSQTPSDVKYFKSTDGSAEGSIVLRAGKDSKVDFTLQSWLHATLPFGTLDIGTIVIMLGTEADSPHFLFEFILSGPVLVVVLDQLPRRDLVLDSAYLKRFYEDTELDKVRQLFERAPDASPYISPVLFIRSVVSPTAAFFKISDNAQVEGGRLDEQIASVVHPGATRMLQVWLDSFRTRAQSVVDRDEMEKRDNEIKEKGVEVDLSANLPRIFGQEITTRVIAAYRAAQ